MTRQELLDSLEQGLPRQTELKRDVIPETLQVRFNPVDKGQEGLDFRGEAENVVCDGEVERLDSETVPGTEDRPVLFVPNGEGEHAPEMVDAVLSPLAIGKENDLRVGIADERFLAEFLSQLDIVIDLAIVDDPVAGPVGHGLGSGGREINDAQPPMAETDELPLVQPDTLAVRTTVPLEVVHHLQGTAQVRHRIFRKVIDTGYAAHVSGFSFSSVSLLLLTRLLESLSESASTP
ncbi:MAG: hypothetical protein A4E73_00872 [Syntrophaceae bacterium PtaU1.Bin231]|nr:MAG: hypothetical protein A4E73_00872 [Syntrophaceae bacterium PtaU1.Bin231]